MPDTGAGMLPPASPTLSKRSGSSSMPGTNAASRSSGPRHQNRPSPSHALNHFANATLGTFVQAGTAYVHCTAHLVFVTKYRHPVFTAIHLDRMEAIMRAVRTSAANRSSSTARPSTSTCSSTSPDRRTVPARQQPEGRLVPAATAGVPRLGPALLAGQAAVVGVVLRRLGRRCSVERPAGLHRAAAPTPRRDSPPA